MSQQFSEEEIEILRAIYPRMDSRAEILTALPNRAYDSIKYKASKLGLRIKYHRSPATEIKRGQHLSPTTEFKKGHLPHSTPFKKGEHFSPSTEFKKGHHPSAPFKKGHIPWIKGKTMRERPSKSTLEALYLSQKLSAIEIASIYQVCDWTVRNWLRFYEIPLRNLSEAERIAQQRPERRHKASETSLKVFRDDPELIKRCVPQKPNEKEKALDLLIQSHFPNEWKYVGNGEVNLGGRCPDWINVNGKKQVLEFFGAYWHDPFVNPKIGFRKTEVATHYHYREYGFDCLVIWQNELEKPRKLLRKIRGFSYA